MEINRKIQAVVRKVSFGEAEEQDDLFWANASFEERMNELISLRMMVFGGNAQHARIEKIVHKRWLHEQTN